MSRRPVIRCTWGTLFITYLLAAFAFGVLALFLSGHSVPDIQTSVDDMYPETPDCSAYEGKPRQFAACVGYR